MNEMVLVINIIINHNNILMHRERGGRESGIKPLLDLEVYCLDMKNK